MGSKPLHLGGFMNFTPGEWDHPSVGGSLGRQLLCRHGARWSEPVSDYIMIEDTLMVSEAYGESAGAG